jgi:hypothetical protein
MLDKHTFLVMLPFSIAILLSYDPIARAAQRFRRRPHHNL